MRTNTKHGCGFWAMPPLMTSKRHNIPQRQTKVKNNWTNPQGLYYRRQQLFHASASFVTIWWFMGQIVTAHIKTHIKIEHFLAKKCSCPEGGGGSGQMYYLANVPGDRALSGKKVLLPRGWVGGGGVISQNAMQVTYIMHCSLPVISLLTCCQKEVLKACTCLSSQGARHFGILPPPPPPGMGILGSFHIGHRNYGVRGEQSRFELPSCLYCSQQHFPADGYIRSEWFDGLHVDARPGETTHRLRGRRAGGGNHAGQQNTHQNRFRLSKYSSKQVQALKVFIKTGSGSQNTHQND